MEHVYFCSFYGAQSYMVLGLLSDSLPRVGPWLGFYLYETVKTKAQVWLQQNSAYFLEFMLALMFWLYNFLLPYQLATFKDIYFLFYLVLKTSVVFVLNNWPYYWRLIFFFENEEIKSQRGSSLPQNYITSK